MPGRLSFLSAREGKASKGNEAVLVGCNKILGSVEVGEISITLDGLGY